MSVYPYSKIVLLQSSTKPLLVAYPNPAKNKLYLDGLPPGYYSIEIADANGKIIQKQNALPGLKYLDISRLNSGVYLLSIISDKDKLTLKFIKN